MRFICRIILITLVFSLLVGCDQVKLIELTPTPTAPTPQPLPATMILKLAMLPILDTLPIYVAEEQGYFSTHGLQVVFIPAASAAERDQLMAAGEADAMVNDLVSVALYNRDEPVLKVVRFARVSAPDAPLYRIVAAKDSGIKTLADLKSVEIGISQASIIDYITDRLLRAGGLAPEDIKTIAVPKIPERMALLGQGQLKAATLPEPFATMAVQDGATVIVDDTAFPQYGNSVLSIRSSLLKEKPELVSIFLAGFDQAVKDINANPQQFTGLLEKYNLIPPAVVGKVAVPRFPEASTPTRSQFEEVVAWCLERELIDHRVEYEDAVVPTIH